MLKFWSLTLTATLATTPALAHVGEHVRLSWLELARHYTEPDHLGSLAVSVGIGALAFCFGRRIASANTSRRENQRP